jgi:hypothetical protein
MQDVPFYWPRMQMNSDLDELKSHYYRGDKIQESEFRTKHFWSAATRRRF